MTGPDPRTDPDARFPVEQALTRLLRAARDVGHRHARPDGWVEVPDPVAYGDITGLLAFADARVVAQLEQALAQYRQVAEQTRARVDAYQRAVHGEHWQPPGEAA